MIRKVVFITATQALLTLGTSFAAITSFVAMHSHAATNNLTETQNPATVNTPAFTTSEQIQQLHDQLGALSLQIRIANDNREREKVAELREMREQVQRELRDLRRFQREEKAAATKQAKRESAETSWATYPPEKQLCAAIEYHRTDLVKQVVEGGQIDLNKTNDYCFFPLGDAAARGHLDIVEYLLERKSPLVMRVPHFQRLISAMDSAAASKHNRTDVLTLLKKHGATVKDSREDSPPGSVTAGGDDATKKLLKDKYNLTAGQLAFGSTLIRALEDGHLANIRWLLKEGADPNESALGRTALMAAVDSNDLDKISSLIQAGADVNQRGLNHASVLTHAQKRRDRVHGQKKAEMDEILRYLQSRGATKSEHEP